MRIHVYTSPEGTSESGLSLTEIKKRIRKLGGSGYTQHFDRDGSFHETTPIVLGNNARTTYQAEYNTSPKYRRNTLITENTDVLYRGHFEKGSRTGENRECSGRRQ